MVSRPGQVLYAETHDVVPAPAGSCATRFWVKLAAAIFAVDPRDPSGKRTTIHRSSSFAP